VLQTTADKVAFTNAHIEGIFAIPRYARSNIVLITENNLGDCAETMHLFFSSKRNVKLWRDPKKPDKAGVCTDERKKKQYRETFDRLLTVKDRIAILDQLVCANPFMDSTTRTEATLAVLETQMRRYIWALQYLDNGKVRELISGKINQFGKLVAGQHDDLMLAVQMLCYWGDEYRTYKGQNKNVF
jgi:hypothetical protein